MHYRPIFVIPRSNLVKALVFTERFWRKASKTGKEEKILDLISDIVLKLCEQDVIYKVNEPKVSRKDKVYRIRIGKYRVFYKVDSGRGWMVFFDIDKRDEHTYRCERGFNTHNILW